MDIIEGTRVRALENAYDAEHRASWSTAPPIHPGTLGTVVRLWDSTYCPCDVIWDGQPDGYPYPMLKSEIEVVG